MEVQINLRLNTLEAMVLQEVVSQHLDKLEQSMSMAECDNDTVYKVCRQVLYSLPFVTPDFLNNGSTDL